jgi:hypothetical protein
MHSHSNFSFPLHPNNSKAQDEKLQKVIESSKTTKDVLLGMLQIEDGIFRQEVFKMFRCFSCI